MIRIVDYGLGNIQAFMNVYKRLGIPAERASTPAALHDATHVILPGVGSFDRAMNLFNASGMRAPLEEHVAKGSAHIIGICVGMQMLAEGSEEGTEKGLGWVPGFVRRIDRLPAAAALPLPHMGWNDVDPALGCPLFDGLTDFRYYFLHSYFFDCHDGASSLATTLYGEQFACAVARHRVHGVQFHPEKSHHWGQALLGNFARL